MYMLGHSTRTSTDAIHSQVARRTLKRFVAVSTGALVFFLGLSYYFLQKNHAAVLVRASTQVVFIDFLKLERSAQEILIHDRPVEQFYLAEPSPNLRLFGAARKNFETQLKNLSQVSQDQTDVNHLETLYQEHLKVFIKTVDVLKQIGHKDWGLIGEFRKTILLVESVLKKKQGNAEITNAYLTLRRHEKDYLLWPDRGSPQRVTEAINFLVAKSKGLPVSDQREVVALLSQYRHSFEAAVNLGGKLDDSNSSLVNLPKEFDESATQIEALLDEMLKSSTQIADQTQHFLEWFLAAGLAITLGTLMLLLTLQNRSLTRTEKELETQRLTLYQSEKMVALGQMAHGVAHEVNNPLMIISSRAQQLIQREKQNRASTEISLQYLDSIIKTTDRIAKIIRGLRIFSRSGETEPFAPVSLTDLVSVTLEFCGGRISAAGVALEVVPYQEISIECRKAQISQVLLNLLNNALEAIITHDEKWVRFEVIHDLKTETIQFVVTDSGPRISDEIAEKMMQPFFTTKEIGKGTGLSLSINKGIVEDHRGKLYLDRTARVTRFVAELPRTQAKLM